ncbi:MAG: hypothetical protein IH840_15050 [Candidatus Heimdallarchaeota archaeon]|nr:hypothetical protein [Candidatus Heimdallarchaeota archaeon]
MSFLTTSEKTLESTRKSFIEFGESVKLENALYCSICKYIITSKGLLEMASQTRWGQPIPNIFFAPIRYILLRGS